MVEDNIIKVTNAAYRIIEFFPEGDPLKSRAKDRTLSIMENLTMLAGTDGWASLQRDSLKRQVLEGIDMLQGYFWVAKAQGWLNSTNFLIISREYENLKQQVGPYAEITQKIPFPGSQTAPRTVAASEVFLIEKESTEPKTSPQKTVKPLSSRQEKIISFLKSHEKAQVMDLQKVLPGVTKRTIRRDLDELLKAGRILREGEFNTIFYKLGQ